MNKQVDDSILDINGKPFSEIQREEFLEKVRKLPAFSKIDDVKEALKESPIVFLRGATGSGKSTQIPKLVCDYKGNANIIITQPRVAAAKSLASRVSDELICETGEENYAVGNRVGYKTGRGVSSNHLSQISYHTSMYELMRLSNSKKFPSLYMLDEIHTDDIGNLFLANIIRQEILRKRKDFKLILSSATMNTEKTLEYFKKVSSDIPIIDIEGRGFPIEQTYGKANEFDKYFKERCEAGDHILIFEKGKREIKNTINHIESIVGEHVTIFEFHSQVSMEEQSKIINYNPRDGEQVIIVATNAAEESLTVPYLNTVIDKGQFKVSSIDETGTERLDSKDISKANSRQRSGRSGRTAPGKSIRVNDTNFEDLPNFATPEITKTTLEREVLILAKTGINLIHKLSEYSDSNDKFLMDNPDPNLVKLTYERLFIHGAIDENGNITSLGEEILSYPLSFFNSRIFVESIKRGVSEDMIEVVSILENKGFLQPKGTWKHAYDKSKQSSFSDLFFYLKIFRDLTSRNLNEKTLNFFGSECDFGFSWREEYKKGEKMLFELIDEEKLEIFGVNKKSIENIVNTIGELTQRLESKNIDLKNIGSKDDKIISLLSGNLTNIYSYDREDRTFSKNYNQSSNNLSHNFILSSNSVIKPETKNSNVYIGNPFIIGETDNTPEIKILQNVTPIEKHHIETFNNSIYGEKPKFDILLENDESRAKRKYLQSLEQVKQRNFQSINPDGKKEKIFDDFYEGIKNSPSYADIIIFLKDITGEIRKEKKDVFVSINAKDTELLKVKRSNTWFASLLENLNNILGGKSVSIDGINHGFTDISKMFLNDPIFSENNIHTHIQALKNTFAEITSISGHNLINTEDIFDKKLTLACNRAVSSDKRKRKYGINKLQGYISKINAIIEQKEGEKIGNKNTDRRINQKLRKLQDLKKNLETFLNISEVFTNSILSINFDNILYAHTNKKKSNIFTKKYLEDVSRKIILGDEFLSDYGTIEKKLEKFQVSLHKYLKDTEIKDLLYALHLLSGSSVLNEKTHNNCLDIVGKYKSRIQNLYTQNINSEKNLQKELESLKEGYVIDTYTMIKSLLSELFEEEYIEQIQAKIFTFTSKIHSLSIHSFDMRLKDFILGLDFKHSLDYGQYFSTLEDYNDYIDYIKLHQRKKVRKEVMRGKLGVTDIQAETVNVNQIGEKLRELKSQLVGVNGL